MEMKLKALQEADFQSPEEFAAFTAAKTFFSARQEGRRYGLDDDDIRRFSVLQAIDAQTDNVLRGRMAAELIHDENVTPYTKMAVAGRYLFPRGVDAEKNAARVPSAETYILLLNAADGIPYDYRPQTLKSVEVVKERAEQDLGVMNFDKLYDVEALERRHDGGTGLSHIAKAALQERLAQAFQNVALESQADSLAGDITHLAEHTGNYNGIAYDLQNIVKKLPHAYGNTSTDRLNTIKSNLYKTIISTGLKNHISPPAGQTPKEQSDNLSKQITDAHTLINNHKEFFSDKPADIANAIIKLRQYQTDVKNKHVGVRFNNFEFGVMFRELKESVKASARNKPHLAADHIGHLMDARIAFNDNDHGSFDSSINSDIVKITQGVNTESAIRIYKTFKEKASVLSQTNHSEIYHAEWPLSEDAAKRLAKAKKDELSAEQRSSLMDAVIDLSNTHEGGKNLLPATVEAFKALDTNDRKTFLGKMLVEDFPGTSNDNVLSIVKAAKEGGDPTVLRGAYLVATQAHINHIASMSTTPAGVKLDTEHSNTKYALQSLSRLYATNPDKGHRKAIRSMVRDHGEELGLNAHDVDVALQSMRAAYKKEHGFLKRGINDVKSLFSGNVKMTDLEATKRSAAPQQKMVPA